MANAVLDGTDCVMLSGETANGDYPVDAVTMMSRTCCEAECALNYDNLYQVNTYFLCLVSLGTYQVNTRMSTSVCCGAVLL